MIDCCYGFLQHLRKFLWHYDLTFVYTRKWNNCRLFLVLFKEWLFIAAIAQVVTRSVNMNSISIICCSYKTYGDGFRRKETAYWILITSQILVLYWLVFPVFAKFTLKIICMNSELKKLQLCLFHFINIQNQQMCFIRIQCEHCSKIVSCFYLFI